jgi:hypothetical protein
MPLKCTICKDPRSPEIIGTYIRIGSVRAAAEQFKVGYRSLHRHISECVPRIYLEEEDRLFHEKLRKVSEKIIMRLKKSKKD